MSTTLALIHPDTLLAAIDVPEDFTTLDPTQRVILPGAREHSGDVTLRQHWTLVRHAKETLDDTVRIGEAMNRLRAQWLRGAQRDFGMVDFVMADLRKRNVNSQLSDEQERLLITCLEALSGINRHWDAGIANKIDQTALIVKQDLIRSFMRAETQGQFQRAMGLFQGLFGHPARTTPGDVRRANDPIIGGDDSAESQLPPAGALVAEGF